MRLFVSILCECVRKCIYAKGLREDFSEEYIEELDGLICERAYPWNFTVLGVTYK